MKIFTKILSLTIALFSFSILHGQEVKMSEYDNAFFNEVDKLPDVSKTTSGLRYKIENKGYEINPKHEVCFEYIIANAAGEVVDQTEEANAFCAMLPDLISGMAEGILLAGESGEILLWIPSQLGYGEKGAGDKIQPNMPLMARIKVTMTVDGDSL